VVNGHQNYVKFVFEGFSAQKTVKNHLKQRKTTKNPKTQKCIPVSTKTISKFQWEKSFFETQKPGKNQEKPENPENKIDIFLMGVGHKKGGIPPARLLRPTHRRCHH
jgi:hypothetical protein